MCYVVSFSTTCLENLSKVESDFFKIEPLGPDEAGRQYLEYPHKWLLVSRFGGCSCHYRHIVDSSMGFGPVEDWYPEEEDDNEATFQFVDFLIPLLKRGERVDVADLFEGMGGPVNSQVVDLATLPRDHFRFFEHVRFDLIWSASQSG